MYDIVFLPMFLGDFAQNIQFAERYVWREETGGWVLLA